MLGPVAVGSILNLTTEGLLPDPTAKTYSRELMTVIHYWNTTAAWRSDWFGSAAAVKAEHVSVVTMLEHGRCFYDSTF